MPFCFRVGFILITNVVDVLCVIVWFYDGLFLNMFIHSNKVHNLKSITKGKNFCVIEVLNVYFKSV